MRSVRANGIRIAFEEAGSGAPLLLLHGFVLDHTLWDAQVETLARSYRLILPDLRALGQTENPDVQISMEQMADDMAGLLMALDIPAAAVAGFSMGGFVLAQMVLRHPLKVRAAAFLCTRATADTAAQQKRRLELMRLVTDEGIRAFSQVFSPHLFSHAYASAHPEGVEKIRRVVEAQRPEGIAAVLDAMRRREDATPRLGEIQVPCAVVAGELDELIQVQDMKELHEGLKDSTFEVIEGSGHMAPMEAPDRVSFALDQLMQRAGMWM
jgi:pimeloyl-ACP methyl ester carboxylesterase